MAARIFILEDSVLFAMALEDELRHRGYEVASAGSLAAARAIISAELFAAALLDLRLPDGHALELARELCERECAVALVTGLDQDQIDGNLAGLTVFSKPTNIGKLADWVDRRVAGP